MLVKGATGDKIKLSLIITMPVTNKFVFSVSEIYFYDTEYCLVLQSVANTSMTGNSGVSYLWLLIHAHSQSISWNKLSQEFDWEWAWISNHINCLMWDESAHSGSNSYCTLTKLPLMLKHELVITIHMVVYYMSMPIDAGFDNFF